MHLVERVQQILFHPRETWYLIEPEATTPGELFKGYIAPLAAIGPVSAFIGMALVGLSILFVGTYRVPVLSATLSALLSYGLGLLGVYVLALIINALAAYLSGEPDLRQALKLAAYSSTPAWIAGIFTLIPGLGLLGLLLSLYSVYLLFLGVPVLMKVPEDKVLPYTALTVVGAVVVSFLSAWLSHAFISLPAPTAPVPAPIEAPPG